MKTHELADVLESLAKLLRSGPNSTLGDVEIRDKLSRARDQSRHIAVNLATLSKLAEIDKQQWLTFIEEYQLPIDLRPRDAARDIIGKLLRYLDSHPEARKRIETPRTGKTDDESPELMKALSFLLRDSKE